MISIKFVKRIKNYAIISFLVPLIAINSCLLIYKFLGDMEACPNFNWDEEKVEYTYDEYLSIVNNLETWTFTNCPKYKYLAYYIDINNQTLDPSISRSIIKENIKFVIIKYEKILNDRHVINHPFLYSLLKKSSLLETLLVSGHPTQNSSSVGFAKIKNPYFYGEVSISRTARYFPAILIFKSLIILSGFLLFIYWKNNLNLFSELKNNNILNKFSKNFFYLGISSCLFLILHAVFLGLDFDAKWFTKMRRLIIILFILSEVFAQILLTNNLFKFKEELKQYINPLILKIKIAFVTIVFFTSCVAFAILVLGDPSTTFKHTLEWNYFSFLLLYYLLSRLLWK